MLHRCMDSIAEEDLCSSKTMAVYTAEPVADAIAVTCTAILFGVQFRKALKKVEQEPRT